MQQKPSVFYTITAVFFLLCIFFIPFPFHLFSLQETITDTLFGALIREAGRLFFHISFKSTLVYSDSRSMYVLVYLLLLISIPAGWLIWYKARQRDWFDRLLKLIYLIAVYYLALMLLKYGFDKVFKHQFYLPEPNILYTPLGKVDKDLLYWSSMGTSRFYNIFAGGVEVLAALFLLFRRSRMAGALLALAILAQVLLINLSFDISVKLYSAVLLGISIFLLSVYADRLRVLFSGKQLFVLNAAPAKPLIAHPFWRVAIRSFLTGFILLESLIPYIYSGNYNDDVAPRPNLYGAYAVQQFIRGTDTLNGTDAPVKRIFIHRQGYLIFQDQQDMMQDYKLDYDTEKYHYVLTDYQQRKRDIDIAYRDTDSILTIRYMQHDSAILLSAKALDWRKLPALQKNFHWTVDE
jgi:hypothetical protein